MAVQLINIGNIANDGAGDDLREAFIKTNANFEELDLRDDEQTTVSNLGSTGEGLFAQKLAYDLEFKKIVGGAGLTLTATADNITIDNDKVYDLTQTAVASDSYVTKQYDFADSRLLYNNVYDTLADLPSASTYHGLFVHVHTTGGAYYSHGGVWSELALKSQAGTPTSPLVHDTSPQLSADLDVQANNLLNVGTISASTVFGNFSGNITGDVTGFLSGDSAGVHTGNVTGNLTGLVHGIDVRTIDVEANLDLGSIVTNINTGIQFFLSTNGIDHGTITAAASINSDFGTFA